ncbi:MAG TPA: tyrosinase family protein [Longimicrobium sp.]|jgi:tyrosinase
MAGIDRRNFLLTALSGLGGLGLASCADSAGTPTLGVGDEILRDLDANGIHLRQNIYCLTEYSSDLIAYRKGVKVMMSRPANDPTSWLAQRAIHWTTAPIIGMIYNQCQHGTLFFLSWHRMYLYWFERIVRAAAGVPSFALPYWGYTPTGQRDLPAPFRLPADPSNVLWTSNRDPSVNGGTPLAPGVVDPGAALALIPFTSFQSSLEGTPHGNVHVAVGGWMGTVPNAALDPIFYLHHAQIDRLWEVWLAMGGGRANPTTPPWTTDVFYFYNEFGAKVGMTGAQIVNTVQQLCYRYVKCSPVVAEPTLVAALDADAARLSDAVGPRPPRGVGEPVADAQVGVRLGARPVTVRVPLSAGAADALRKFEEGGEGNDIVLLLQEVALLQAPRVYYEVYANLSAAAGDTTYGSPNFTGNLDFFGIPAQSDTLHAAHGGSLRRLSLLRAYSYLRSRGQWNDAELTLTFVPRGYTEDVDPARVLSSDQAVIGAISVQLQ